MNIVFSGGGTGGHLFPGIALAQEFQRRAPQCRILFIGARQGIETREVPRHGFALQTLDVRGMLGTSLRNRITATALLAHAFLQAGRCLWQFRADLVIGLGGYSSFPAMAAGAALRIPVVLHEQNTIPGLSNRMLSKLCRRVFLSWPHSETHFSRRTALLTGMPVRNTISGRPRPAESRLTILVVGGSQGAHQINQALIDALPQLADLTTRLRFIHQTGERDQRMVENAYAHHGCAARVQSFFTDIGRCYQQADLVIARAGASTLAEIALCRLPAILIPYPWAAHNHQEHNARCFVDAGAAQMILATQLNGTTMAAAIKRAAEDPALLTQMADHAESLARPEAAARIVDECLRLVRNKGAARV